MPKFSHVFDVAFTVESDHPWDEVSAGELLVAVSRRMTELSNIYIHDPMGFIEAFGQVDSVEIHDVT